MQIMSAIQPDSILLMSQWQEQFYKIVKKKKKIQQLINLSFYSSSSRITNTKTDRESLKLEQRALKIQIKTKIWTKETQSFLILMQTFKFNSHACHCAKIVPIHPAAELPTNITK